jgi:diguanylate cyclase (GGDEF)-like protein/PAS domain S-box-containing protein
MPYRAEATLSALTESTDDFIWSVDLDFGLLTFNRALKQDYEVHFGTRPAVGMRPEQLLPPDLAATWPPLYQRVLAEGPLRVECLFSKGRTLELTMAPIVVHGKSTGISVFGKDVTEKRIAEQALLEAEKKNRDIFNNALEGMFHTTPEGRCIAANPALARMFGYDSPEDLMTSVLDTTHDIWLKPQERQRYQRLVEKQGTVRGFECRHKRKDGSIIWVSLSAQKVCRADGKTLYYEGFIEEITERKRAHVKLRDSEERFRATFDQAAIGIAYVDFDGRILRCNPRFAEIIGYPLEEIAGKSLRDLTPAEYLAETMENVQRVKKGASRVAGWEKPYIRKDGSLTWVKVTSSVQNDGVARPLHIVNFVEDINARKAAEKHLEDAAKALQASEERYRTVFQASLDAICISRLSDGQYIDVNETFLKLVGLSRDEVVGHTALEIGLFANPEDRETLVQILRQNSSFRDEKTRFKRRNGEVYWVLLSVSLIVIDGVPCAVAITRDISDAKAAEDQIANLAFYDPLTQLANRRLLLDRLRQSLSGSARSGSKRALLLLDLDNFKHLNDTIGHSKADLFLQEVARRLSASVYEADTVARFSGDGFAVLLANLSEVPEVAATQARTVSDKIHAAIAQPYHIDGNECRTTSCIGITVFGDDSEGAHDLLQQADLAMHQAKAAGHNTTRFFSPSLQAAVNARATMEKDLRRAIRGHQFSLYFQPQVDSTGLIGAEALIRWNHPRRGLLCPSEFIPFAEETGMILPIGDWVLETACAQIAQWAARPELPQIPLAVNVSARQFRQPDFVQHLLDILDRTGANPENLKLELTESMLANDLEVLIDQMTVLKSVGIKFSLDDFGTGYSSLTYLKRLPLDQLKIDRAFVRDILGDVASDAIAETIISLGRAMGLAVIAEGVETEDQREFLARLGCHSFQGFLFSQALPLHEFEQSPLFRLAAAKAAVA